MATYKQIQDHLKGKYNRTFKSCWIAHIKSEHGLTKGHSPNRHDPTKRVHPCPDEHRYKIEEAFRHFQMIP